MPCSSCLFCLFASAGLQRYGVFFDALLLPLLPLVLPLSVPHLLLLLRSLLLLLQDAGGGGDCLFLSVALGLSGSGGRSYGVQELRRAAANKAAGIDGCDPNAGTSKEGLLCGILPVCCLFVFSSTLCPTQPFQLFHGFFFVCSSSQIP